MGEAILSRYNVSPAGGGRYIPEPPEIIAPAQGSASYTSKITDSAWTGTGVQILTGTSDNELIDVSEHESVYTAGVKWIVFNMRPKEYTPACEIYTPYLTNFFDNWGIDSDPLYPNEEIEFFWNPVRQTYQTAVPVHNGILSGIEQEVPDWLLEQTFVYADMNKDVKWVLRPPTQVIIGAVPGIIVNRPADSTAGSDKNVIRCSNDSQFRLPGTISMDAYELAFHMGMGLNAGTAMSNVAAQALTLLRIQATDIDYSQAADNWLELNMLGKGTKQKAPIDTYK